MKYVFLFCFLISLKIPIVSCQNAGLIYNFLKNDKLADSYDLPGSPFFLKNYRQDFDKKFDIKNLKMERRTARPMAFALPRWKAEELPFFCKIEHRAAKKLPLPMKFRLGSVNYVDWLEGKSCTGNPDF